MATTQTRARRVQRPWGHFFTVYRTPHIWVKTIVLNPWSQTSLQIHEHREEHWHVPEGRLQAIIGDEPIDLNPYKVYTVGYRVPHRIMNRSRYVLSLTEVAYGDPDEGDIIRLEDDYGRIDGMG